MTTYYASSLLCIIISRSELSFCFGCIMPGKGSQGFVIVDRERLWSEDEARLKYAQRWRAR